MYLTPFYPHLKSGNPEIYATKVCWKLKGSIFLQRPQRRRRQNNRPIETPPSSASLSQSGTGLATILGEENSSIGDDGENNGSVYWHLASRSFVPILKSIHFTSQIEHLESHAWICTIQILNIHMKLAGCYRQYPLNFVQTTLLQVTT